MWTDRDMEEESVHDHQKENGGSTLPRVPSTPPPPPPMANQEDLPNGDIYEEEDTNPYGELPTVRVGPSSMSSDLALLGQNHHQNGGLALSALDHYYDPYQQQQQPPQQQLEYHQHLHQLHPNNHHLQSLPDGMMLTYSVNSGEIIDPNAATGSGNMLKMSKGGSNLLRKYAVKFGLNERGCYVACVLASIAAALLLVIICMCIAWPGE